MAGQDAFFDSFYRNTTTGKCRLGIELIVQLTLNLTLIKFLFRKIPILV